MHLVPSENQTLFNVEAHSGEMLNMYWTPRTYFRPMGLISFQTKYAHVFYGGVASISTVLETRSGFLAITSTPPHTCTRILWGCGKHIHGPRDQNWIPGNYVHTPPHMLWHDMLWMSLFFCFFNEWHALFIAIRPRRSAQAAPQAQPKLSPTTKFAFTHTRTKKEHYLVIAKRSW